MHKAAKKYEDMCELKDRILCYIEAQCSSGMTNNPQEIAILGEYVDMVKDLAEAEKSCQEACYYESVVEAMQDSGMNGRMGYNPSRMRDWDWDMDEADRRRMKKGEKPGDDHDAWGDGEDREMDPRHGEAFNKFRSAKRHYTQTHSEADHQKMKQHANDHLMETMATLHEIWDDADPELKKRMKGDLTKFTTELTV